MILQQFPFRLVINKQLLDILRSITGLSAEYTGQYR